MSDSRDAFFGRPIPREESIRNLGTRAGATARGERTPMETERAPPVDASALQEKFTPRSPRARIEDLIVSDATASLIRQALARITHHDTLYNEWGLDALEPQGRRVVLNLYGPPGTGKTLCAEAIAQHFGKSIVEVSYAEIESKYVGETPKNIVAAFRCATNADAVLFFDEADSILGRRMTNVTQAADHSVNVSRAVMLKELDAFTGIVVFATNLAKNFDAAFVRRILSHIEVGLPDHDTRVRLWKKLLPTKLPGIDALDPETLAVQSDSLAGGEIKNAIILAACDAVLRTDDARRVTAHDLEHAILRVRQAKLDVGHSDYERAPRSARQHIETVEVTEDELPADVKAQLDAGA